MPLIVRHLYKVMMYLIGDECNQEEFIKNTAGYEFDCPTGIFYEEHIFSERWFQNGGIPNGFRMWVPIIKK